MISDASSPCFDIRMPRQEFLVKPDELGIADNTLVLFTSDKHHNLLQVCPEKAVEMVQKGKTGRCCVVIAKENNLDTLPSSLILNDNIVYEKDNPIHWKINLK